MPASRRSMTRHRDDDAADTQLDIIELLDDRSRLREDPDRRPDLLLTYERLRERLRRIHLEEED